MSKDLLKKRVSKDHTVNTRKYLEVNTRKKLMGLFAKMRVVDANRFIKIQVIKIYNEHTMTSAEIARFLNKVNPQKFRLKVNVGSITVILSFSLALR